MMGVVITGRRKLATLALCSALVLPGCTANRAPAVHLDMDGDLYDRLYPYHAEVCAVTQIRPLDAPVGGSAGHAVMYLKGACKQPDASFPLLETCEGRPGVGISVNKMFRNVNWVAIPERGFFLQGDLGERQRLTQSHFDATVRKAVDLGMFRGVAVHPQHLDRDPGGPISEEVIARDSIGTDYALSFGRSIFCAKLPVAPAMMEEIVDFLNDLNKEYATGEADYEWSGYHDNCTHTIYNALANASVWKPKSINMLRLLQIFNLAIPANAFVDLAELGNDFPLENLPRVQRDSIKRTALQRYDWLPTQHGALIETIGVHEANDLYDTGFKIFVLQGFLRQNKRRQAREMLSDPRYSDPEANLRHFKTRYEAILAERPEDWNRASDPKRFADTQRRYYAHIAQQLVDLERKLAALPEDEEGSGRDLEE